MCTVSPLAACGVPRLGDVRTAGRALVDLRHILGDLVQLEHGGELEHDEGCDLVLVDRSTGDTVARVDPPEKDGVEG